MISITEKKKAFVNFFEDGEEKVALLTVNSNYQQERPLLEFLNKILFEYQQTTHETTDLRYPYSAFVEPVLTFLVEKFPTDQECNQIAVLLRKAAAKYDVVIQQGTGLAAALQEYQRELNEHASELELETQKLRSEFRIIT